MSLTVSCVPYKKCPAPRISAGAGFLCRLAAGPPGGFGKPFLRRAATYLLLLGPFFGGGSLFRVWFDGCVSYMI